MASPASTHIRTLTAALAALDTDQLQRWGRELGHRLPVGARLLAAGNGGSAAEAQHLTSELLGRYAKERAPLSAIALHADTSALTAIGNDYGPEQVFARQVRAHGRPGDILLLLSASGRSPNILAAAEAGRTLGLDVWALTGPAPNPLAELSTSAVCVAAPSVAAVQEAHLVAIHIVCAEVEDVMAGSITLAGSVDELPAAEPVADQQLDTRRHLVVVGDVLLDQDTNGVVHRLSPEGPIPVVSGAVTLQRPGGAGLAAIMAAAAPGWRVSLLCALGSDDSGRRVRALLEAAGIDVLDVAASGSTAVKTRVRAAGRTLVRIDTDHEPITIGPLSEAARLRLSTAAAVLVCDYGRGITASPTIRQALQEAAARCPVVWDPHPRGDCPVAGVTLAVPSADEARALSTAVGDRDLAGDLQCALELLELWPVRHVAVTRGEQGAILISNSKGHPLVIPAPRIISGGDTCGAGDRLAVTAALALGAGRLPSEALAAAVAEATSYVEAGSPAALSARPQTTKPSRNGAIAAAEQVRAAGGRIIGAGGCFDLLHTGHVSLLEQARRLGDLLIVCMNSDASVARLKGPSRPVTGETERAALLQALGCVDGVLVFDEDTPERVLAQLRPHVWVKGGDYAGRRIPETDLVESWGGRVVVVPYLEGRSTTSLIARVAQTDGAR
ncbi:MAG: D-glycero-beta-D-manno-heptose 1-phosphate adenylyltransferase [Catenulispora sp.]|nr:D-glycero-beta-D-manno-heptose 1-phosphate adenylyltransferase [Catenulispora sp.]NUR57229.1 D-glycero-beta-D-manno-heptose 1-phosphate adenylyltransferase [Catenulispora sp.]